MSETHQFQAEVQRVLDIVINSLYTDKEIFVRELVSNASDALEKLRHTQITEKEIHDDNLSLEINLTTDDKAGTLTIQDFGIGMNREELVENLGTIAHSGSKKFLEAMKEGDAAKDNIIGQFGSVSTVLLWRQKICRYIPTLGILQNQVLFGKVKVREVTQLKKPKANVEEQKSLFT